MFHKDTAMVFFDAGETLIHPSPSFPELLSSVCKEHGLAVNLSLLPAITRGLMSHIEDKQRNGFTFTSDAETSRHFWLDFYSGLVREMGYDKVDGDLPYALYEAFSDPSNYESYHDVVETLDELKRRGMRLGLISNFEDWLDDLLDRLGLKSYFEVVVISGREGFEKPHPVIFEIALERGRVDSNLALHVGDSPISDLEGALNVGMQALLLDRWERFPHIKDLRVRDLREIPPLLNTRVGGEWNGSR
ncbi:MAG: HAD-IA family hydrolase [Actinomycetota bacterium]|nr:HAD-IA family hydrolase [Actinomycetota bacterium]